MVLNNDIIEECPHCGSSEDLSHHFDHLPRNPDRMTRDIPCTSCGRWMRVEVFIRLDVYTKGLSDNDELVDPPYEYRDLPGAVPLDEFGEPVEQTSEGEPA